MQTVSLSPLERNAQQRGAAPQAASVNRQQASRSAAGRGSNRSNRANVARAGSSTVSALDAETEVRGFQGDMGFPLTANEVGHDEEQDGGAVTKDGCFSRLIDPRIEMPAIEGITSGYTVDLRQDRTLYYLDVRIQSPDEDQLRTGTAYPSVRSESINLWHRGFGHCNEQTLTSTANIKEAGVVLKDRLSPCKTCFSEKSTQKAHPKLANHTATQPGARVYTDLLGPIHPTAKGGYRTNSPGYTAAERYERTLRADFD